MARKWVSVTPGDYDLEFAKTVERAVSLLVEEDLRVQVLRIRPASLAEATVKDALEQQAVARAVVWGTSRFLYAILIHEE